MGEEPKEIEYRVISRRETTIWTTPTETQKVLDVYFEAPPYGTASVYIPVEEVTPERVEADIKVKIEQMKKWGPTKGKVVTE